MALFCPFLEQAFDGHGDTHWFSRDGRCLNGRMAAHVWLEYCLPAQRGPVTLARYNLTSASGCAKNDPMVVILYGVRCDGCPSYLVPQEVSTAVLFLPAWAHPTSKKSLLQCCLCQPEHIACVHGILQGCMEKLTKKYDATMHANFQYQM